MLEDGDLAPLNEGFPRGSRAVTCRQVYSTPTFDQEIGIELFRSKGEKRDKGAQDDDSNLR